MINMGEQLRVVRRAGYMLSINLGFSQHLFDNTFFVNLLSRDSFVPMTYSSTKWYTIRLCKSQGFIEI